MRSKWFELKPKAITLRTQGKSIRDIEEFLDVPRSTLSGWLKNVKLTASQYKLLEIKHQKALVKARKLAVVWHNKQKSDRLKFAENEALYNRQLEAARLFLTFFNLNIPDRLSALAEFLKGEGALNPDKAAAILEIWQRAARDLALNAVACPELIQHTALSSELDSAGACLSSLNNEEALRHLCKILELLSMLKNYLAANVAPILVLEQVVYNL